MPITKLRKTFAPLAAAFSIALAAFSIAAAVGPISVANAQDNSDPDIQAGCDRLEDAYNRASQYASDARAAGNQSEYQFWLNQIEGIYFDAQFDLECDWATEAAIHRGRGGFALPQLQGYAIFSDGTAGPVGPTVPATKNSRTYSRWLRSKNHRLACANLNKVSRGVGQDQADLIRVAAHFAHCGWAGELPQVVEAVAPDPAPQTDGPTESSGETPQPESGPGPLL